MLLIGSRHVLLGVECHLLVPLLPSSAVRTSWILDAPLNGGSTGSVCERPCSSYCLSPARPARKPGRNYVTGPFHHWLKLRAEIEQSRLDFIRTDLGVCLMFATIAETAYSMGHRAHAERTLASAEKGYSDMLRYFLRARGMTPEVEEELQSTLKRLRERLDGLSKFR